VSRRVYGRQLHRPIGKYIRSTFHQRILNLVGNPPSNVDRSCNYHIRSLSHIRPPIDRETAVNLACSIVTSRLDYCKSVLYMVSSETSIAKLQRMPNNLARVVCKSRRLKCHLFDATFKKNIFSNRRLCLAASQV